MRRHRYTNAEEPAPSPPPNYNTPSPTNPAAFEATVGLHANEWFNLDAPVNVPFLEIDPSLYSHESEVLVQFLSSVVGNDNDTKRIS